jgi:hypothetical protein
LIKVRPKVFTSQKIKLTCIPKRSEGSASKALPT